jgi:hypothetical protein
LSFFLLKACRVALYWSFVWRINLRGGQVGWTGQSCQMIANGKLV